MMNDKYGEGERGRGGEGERGLLIQQRRCCCKLIERAIKGTVLEFLSSISGEDKKGSKGEMNESMNHEP